MNLLGADQTGSVLPLWAVVLIPTGASITALVLGVLGWFNSRKTIAATATKDRATATKDAAEASAVARKDLVEEVDRLDRALDRERLNREADRAADRAARDADRAACDEQIAELRKEMASERRWSALLARSLRDAGIPVPERGTS